MKRSLLVIALLMMTSIAASAVEMAAASSFSQKNSEVLVNNVPLPSDWDFSYTVDRGVVTSGDLSEGPMISYLTTRIIGDITLPVMSDVLNDSLKNRTEFTITYRDHKSNMTVTFGRCKVIDAIFSNKPSGGQKAVYTFRAISLS
jgi:hypothetical protein